VKTQEHGSNSDIDNCLCIMLFYDSFCIYPCNCYVHFWEKIKLFVSVSVSDKITARKQTQTTLQLYFDNIYMVNEI